MANWCGKIGFAINSETSPGIWEPTIVEQKYYGQVVNLKRSLQSSSDGVNDNKILKNSISIIADPFANNNFSDIAYVEFRGKKWKISEVEVQFPRLILSLGGVYNG